MKAFLHRLHIGGGTSKDKEKEKDRDHLKEKFPPLRTWPPQQQRSNSDLKPLPEITPSTSSTHDSSPPKSIPDIPTDPDPQLETDSAPPRPAAPAPPPADVHKKVAFISPPPTPATVERPLPDVSPSLPSPPSAPLKTTVSRFQATHAKEPRASVSTAASSSKSDVATPKTAVRATSTRATSPYLDRQTATASASSLRSGTPYSHMSNSSGSRILAAASWSEVTEEDLVSNIGSRERTRQEVLFEIISSEERYVQELIKMKDTFIDPLLHPFSTPTIASPISSTPNVDYVYYQADSSTEPSDHDHLPPIAARFMSPTPTNGHRGPSASSTRVRETPNIDGESLDTDDEHDADDQPTTAHSTRRTTTLPASKLDHPRSPYHATHSRMNGRSNGAVSVPFPSRSHMSLPPPPRAQMSASAHSLGRQSTIVEKERERKVSQGDGQKTGVFRKFKKSQPSPVTIFGDHLAPHQLPEDLRICLEVVDSGVLDGHKRLSDALRKRHDDQFPLVRSLADVFVANSDIFHGYATYVLHLERALEQADAALSNVSTKKPKKQDTGEWQKVCKFLQKLEEDACDKGETGLAITLSKPFQRLLKYPLLFQNLLFHTDPSTFEYESTLQMVAEVETIVRSIEDEKIQKEERDKTRDIFARIEGLDKVKQLVLPKPSRILVEERPCAPQIGTMNASKASSPPVSKGVRGKSSFRRLTDVLSSGHNGIGGKKDLWFVVFNDVVLQCQRTGTTSLPLVAVTTSRTNSLPELQGKAKYATTGRRNIQTKPRNLYKFIKIHDWAMRDVVQSIEGVVTMEDVVRSSAQARAQPKILPLPDEDEDTDDTDESDKKSKMSFSYWGADKVTVQRPVVKGRVTPNSRRGTVTTSYSRESSANAKFGTRLISDGSSHPRPISRRAQAATPTPRRPAPSDDSPNYAKATITRPAWGAGAGSPVPPTAAKRTRNTSQTGTPNKVTTPPQKTVVSPAPSEDSGVGLYRQMLANDPSLNDS